MGGMVSMKKFVLILLVFLSGSAFAADPTWFNRNGAASTNLDIYRYFRQMFKELRCEDPRLPWQEVCSKSADAHNTIVDLGICLEDPRCPFTNLQTSSRFYFRVNYPEFREVYGKQTRTPAADAILQNLTRASIILQDYFTAPPTD
jgi:hypothetical protein